MLQVEAVETQPLKKRTKFHVYLSKSEVEKWVAKESEQLRISSHTKVSAAHTCCWVAPKKHVVDGHHLQLCYSKSGGADKLCELPQVFGKGF